LSSHSYDEFRELCALSTSDALTLEERILLNEHLRICASCRALKTQYEQIAFDLIPALAADIEEKAADLRSYEEQKPSESPQNLEIRSSRWTSGRRIAASIIILLGSVLAYGIFVRSVQNRDSALSSKTPTLPVPTITSVEHIQNENNQQESNKEVAALRDELKRQLTELARLKADRSRLENDLAKRKIDLDQSSQEKSLLNQRIASADAQVRELKDRFDEISSHESKEGIQLGALQVEVSDLKNQLQQKDRDIAQDQDLLRHDRDIRDLIAARDLYIVDVYDSKKSGAFQKPVGRVFYTKDKSLVFYGYNLDQQPGLTNASTFQVWGTIKTNESNISLGIFYRDDASKSRWILKYNDAKTIAQLDRIFVTVEPAGGSKQPTSKPLLATSLRIEPNHP